MTAEIEDIRQLAAAMRLNGVDRLVVERNGSRLRLELPAGVGAATPPAKGVAIRSPGIGSFRPRGAGDGLPGLTLGATVRAGDILGYVAEGPLLQAIVASAAGRLSRRLAAAGQELSYGDPVFSIEERACSST